MQFSVQLEDHAEHEAHDCNDECGRRAVEPIPHCSELGVHLLPRGGIEPVRLVQQVDHAIRDPIENLAHLQEYPRHIVGIFYDLSEFFTICMHAVTI